MGEQIGKKALLPSQNAFPNSTPFANSKSLLEAGLEPARGLLPIGF